MQQKYDAKTAEYNLTAREYFMVLRLAIYRVDRNYVETSAEVAQYAKSSEVYRVACNILDAMYKVKGAKHEMEF